MTVFQSIHSAGVLEAFAPGFTHTSVTRRFGVMQRSLGAWIEAERDLEHSGSWDPACDHWLRDAEAARAAVGAALPWPAPESLVLKFVAHHLWDPAERATDPDQWNRPVRRGGQERVLIDPAQRRLRPDLTQHAHTVAIGLSPTIEIDSEERVLTRPVARGEAEQQPPTGEDIHGCSFLRERDWMPQGEHDPRCSEQDVLGRCGEVAEVGDGVEDLSGVAEVTRSPHRHVPQPERPEPEPVGELRTLLMPGQVREESLTGDVSSGEIVVQGQLDPEGQAVLGE